MTTRRRATTTASDRYEVIWSGVNDGRDGDLLTPIAVQFDKHAAVARAPKQVDVTDRVEQALPTRAVDAVTSADLMAATGLTLPSVTNALYQLRHRGRLKTAEHRPLRAPQRYWRVTESPNETIVVDAVRAWLRE